MFQHDPRPGAVFLEYVERGKRDRSTCFRDEQVRRQLSVLAYNLGNFLRRSALPASVQPEALTTLPVKLIKAGAKVVRGARVW